MVTHILSHTHTHTHAHTHSTEEEKGSDCIPQFRAMQECFLEHPEEYGKFSDDDEENEGTSKDSEETAPKTESRTDSNTASSTQLKETA